MHVIARVAQWEKDRKARMEAMNADRISKMETDNKAAMVRRPHNYYYYLMMNE